MLQGTCTRNLSPFLSLFSLSFFLVSLLPFRTEQQSRYLAFCLSQISYNERGLRKLQDNLSCYQGLLTDKEVYGYFMSIIGKGKKLGKAEVKVCETEIKEKEGGKSERDYHLLCRHYLMSLSVN